MPIHHAERTCGISCHKTFAVLKGFDSFTEEDQWIFMYTMEHPAFATKENLEFISGVIVNLSRQYHYILAPICIFLPVLTEGMLSWGFEPAVCILHCQKMHHCVFASSKSQNYFYTEGQRPDLNLYKSLSQGELITQVIRLYSHL